MVNIIVQLSKYLMILMITVYTYLCFSIFGYYDPDKKKRCLRKQNVLMFVMHLTAFLVMYLEKKDTKILALYLRLLIFLPAILIPACASSSPAFLMMYSAYKLNKQGDNIQP